MKPYPKYKDSGIEWLGEVPEEWHITNLRRLSSVISKGTTPSTLGKDLVDEGVRFIKGENIQGGEIIDTPAHFIDIETDDMLSRSRLQAHDVLFVIAGSIGKTAIVNESDTPANTNQAICFIRLSNTNHSKYVHYWLSTDLVQQLVSLDLVQTAQPNVSMDDIGRIPLLLAETAETNAIVTFLDRETARIDALIQNKERMIELLKEKRIALITQTVTKGLDPTVPMKDSGIEWLGEVPEHWEVKAIKRSTPVQRGASPRPIDDPNYFDEEGEYAWVRISDVTESKVFLEKTTQRLSELGSSLSVKLKPGTIFVSIAGTVGIPCITSIKCCIHDGFVYFPKLKMLPKFLYYVFESGEPYKGLGKLGTQLNLNTDTIGSVVIGVPPIHEQQVIVECIDRRLKHIEKLISAVEQSISLLREYRSSLIHHAVTGKIDLRGYDAQAQ